MNKIKKVCENCKFFNNNDDPFYGECRFSTPQIKDKDYVKDYFCYVGFWPVVTLNDWCGEWTQGRWI